MKATTNNKLDKNRRIKSRKLTEQLFSKGQRFALFPIRVLYFIQHQDLPRRVNLQAGVAVSSRQFKKAVDRNRIKRLLREAYRIQKQELESLLEKNHQQLFVFFVFTGKEIPEYQLLKERLGVILQKLSTIANESTIANN
jgi:ribonuclease P protein component